MHVRNLGNRTIGSNEVRHRNFNKVEDRVKPNSSLSLASLALTVKGKYEGLKNKGADKNVSLTALWQLHNFDAKSVTNCILIGKKSISDKYDYVRMNDTTWYVCRKYYSLGVVPYTSKTCALVDKAV